MTHTPDDRARRRVVPLAPPAGRFDEVVHAARARRRQRGVVGAGTVAVASVVVGSVALVGRPHREAPAESPAGTVTAATAGASAGDPASVPTASTQAPEPNASARVRTTEDLPLYAHYVWNFDEGVLIQRASTGIVAACMRTQGRAYDGPIARMTAQEEAQAYQEVMQPYGAWDPERARTVGYHHRGWDRTGREIQTEPATVTPPGELVAGTPECRDEVWKQLKNPMQAGYDVEVWKRLREASDAAAERDPRVRAVIDQWSSCMQDAGFTYASPATPAEAVERAATGGPTAAEITTAVTDVACKQKTGLIDVWLDVLEREQRKVIADPRNKPALDAQKKAFTETLARARQILNRAS